MKGDLSNEELDHFRKKGWVGVFPLLTRSEVGELSALRERVMPRFFPALEMPSLSQGHSFAARPWFKSMHAFVDRFFDLAANPMIVGRLRRILGPDIIAWGLCTTFRKPGQIHRWHVDVEHRRWRGVSVYIGLAGATPESSLKVVDGSHLIREMPQDLDVSSDGEAVAVSRKFVPDAKLVTVAVNEGEFFIFDGPLWHGSSNETDQCRIAAIIQYTTPDQKVEIPTTWLGKPGWHTFPPPCVLVSGVDRYKRNCLVDKPS